MKVIVIGGGPSRNDGGYPSQTKWKSSDFARKDEIIGKKTTNNRKRKM